MQRLKERAPMWSQCIVVRKEDARRARHHDVIVQTLWHRRTDPKTYAKIWPDSQLCLVSDSSDRSSLNDKHYHWTFILNAHLLRGLRPENSAMRHGGVQTSQNNSIQRMTVMQDSWHKAGFAQRQSESAHACVKRTREFGCGIMTVVLRLCGLLLRCLAVLHVKASRRQGIPALLCLQHISRRVWTVKVVLCMVYGWNWHMGVAGHWDTCAPRNLCMNHFNGHIPLGKQKHTQIHHSKISISHAS